MELSLLTFSDVRFLVRLIYILLEVQPFISLPRTWAHLRKL